MPAGTALLPWLAGFLVFAAAMLAGLGAARLDPVGRRARRLAGLSAASPVPANLAELKAQVLDRLRGLARRLALEEGEKRRRIETGLAQAGFRRPEAFTLFQLARLSGPTVGGLAGWLIAPPLAGAQSLLGHLPIAAAGGLLGAAAPSIWLANARERRQRRLLAQLPMALDLYVICLESGLGPDAAMVRVARELGPAAPDMADELGLAAIELGFLPDRGEALRNLCDRAPLEEIRALVALFQQAERYGTPLAEALRVLADGVREAMMLRAEERAARLPAVLTVPLILFVLPPLFVVLLGPAILQLMAGG